MQRLQSLATGTSFEKVFLELFLIINRLSVKRSKWSVTVLLGLGTASQPIICYFTTIQHPMMILVFKRVRTKSFY